jgi:hypothetical protein
LVLSALNVGEESVYNLSYTSSLYENKFQAICISVGSLDLWGEVLCENIFPAKQALAFTYGGLFCEHTLSVPYKYCDGVCKQCDLEGEGMVKNKVQMDDYCRENNFVGWYETSAKENINIDEAARCLITRVSFL